MADDLRAERIIALRNQGATWRAIAAEIGVSTSRASRIYQDACRRRERKRWQERACRAQQQANMLPCIRLASGSIVRKDLMLIPHHGRADPRAVARLTVDVVRVSRWAMRDAEITSLACVRCGCAAWDEATDIIVAFRPMGVRSRVTLPDAYPATPGLNCAGSFTPVSGSSVTESTWIEEAFGVCPAPSRRYIRCLTCGLWYAADDSGSHILTAKQ